jgi:hypothetical protein
MLPRFMQEALIESKLTRTIVECTRGQWNLIAHMPSHSCLPQSQIPVDFKSCRYLPGQTFELGSALVY